MSKEYKKLIQQGDVLMYRTGEPGRKPEDAKAVGRDGRGRLVLAEGEATGHHHAIADPGVDAWTTGEKMNSPQGTDEDYESLFFSNEKEVTVTHEEHKPVTLPPGTWERRIVREYDHFAEEARRVID